MKKYALCLGTALALTLTVPGISVAKAANFQPPQLKQAVKPVYPQSGRTGKSASSSEDSGVVELAFMVDKSGKANEIIVTRSTMAKFDESAIKALSRYQFEPATLDGKPVDSRASINVLFKFSAMDANAMSGARSSQRLLLDHEAPQLFDNYYKRFFTALDKDKADKEDADHLIKQMQRLDDQTFASLAYTAQAKSRFADQFGDLQQRIDAYSELLWLNDFIEEKYRPVRADALGGVYSQLIALQLEASQFADALDAFAEAKKRNITLDDRVANLQARVVALQGNDQVTLQKLRIDERGYAELPLFKQSFEVSNVNGRIAQLAARCDTRFGTFDFQADTNFALPESWGGCNLQVIGEPGSEADLLQK